MTKNIHMINGDTSTYKVKVLVQDRLYDHELNQLTDTWVTTEILRLDNPGQLQTKYLTSTRRFIIEEDGSNT